jgi:vanillate O-demethylase monooxygenase subunit
MTCRRRRSTSASAIRDHLDRWFIYDFVLPGTLADAFRRRPVGASGDDMRNAVQLHSCQTLTPRPRPARTTSSSSRTAPARRRADRAVDLRQLVGAFNEDRDMISAQARNIGRAARTQRCCRSASIRRWSSSGA